MQKMAAFCQLQAEVPQVPVMTTASSALSITEEKLIKALVLDAGPLLSNTVPATSFIARAEKIYTTPQVISEIRDPAARQRLETQWNIFLNIRAPQAESVKFVKEFVKKGGTGDDEVFSSADWGVLGLAYELECELRGNRDWVRKDVPKREVITSGNERTKRNDKEEEKASKVKQQAKTEGAGAGECSSGKEEVVEDAALQATCDKSQETAEQNLLQQLSKVHIFQPSSSKESNRENSSPDFAAAGRQAIAVNDTEQTCFEDDSDDSDWITPSNIHRHQAKSKAPPLSTALPPTQPMYAGCSTTDFAMQNILLLLPIPLISPNNPQTRIRTLKSWVLRCHACFYITRTMSLQFCPRCGGPTLLRTSCSTDTSTGKTRIYLKKNFQWNNRGNVYSIPKPTGGRASGKVGNGIREELVLRADQKEYLRQKDAINRRKKNGEKDWMDRDYLPSILTGERTLGPREWVTVGHGKRNPNEKGFRKKK